MVGSTTRGCADVDYASARTKADAVARMYLLGGAEPELVGPGSKEKRSSLVALGGFVGLEDLPSGKVQAGRLIAQHLGVTWDDSCFSQGDTITLVGLNRLIDASVKSHGMVVDHDVRNDLVTRVMGADRQSGKEHRVGGIAAEGNRSEVLGELEGNFAELIEQLASTHLTPLGVEPASTNIDADSVRIVDGSWRERLFDVRGWLRLPTDLDASNPLAFDASLAAALGSSGSERDQEALLALVTERLDRATALRDDFVSRMDETGEGSETLATATQAWVTAWEEVDDEEEESDAEGAPINADADNWPIIEFVQHAEDDELDLSPSYQRGDVWPTGDAQLLIESILRGIPLPSVIILQADVGQTTSYEVVDGKQRLTAILRFIGAHPRATALVSDKSVVWGEPGAPNLFKTNYPEFKKLWNAKESEKLTAQLERRLHFPFALRRPSRGPLGPNGSMSALKGRYYSEIREETIQVQGLPKKVKSVFEQASAYKLPVITYKKVTPAQIHEVFSLYNKQGKHLNAEEIRNALFHELDFMRALLVTAGDSEDVGAVAPFLAGSWGDLQSTSKTLDSYGFGRVGYKRTKILSWAAAALLLDDGVVGRSTAGHINALLKRVQENSADPLRDPHRVLTAMTMLDHGLDAHAVIEANQGWAPIFRNKQKRGKWQELQLVAALIGMSAASLVLGEELIALADDVTPAMREASSRWERPGSAQSKDQWQFMARVVNELLAVLEVDPSEADAAIKQHFGESGLAALLRA